MELDIFNNRYYCTCVLQYIPLRHQRDVNPATNAGRVGEGSKLLHYSRHNMYDVCTNVYNCNDPKNLKKRRSFLTEKEAIPVNRRTFSRHFLMVRVLEVLRDW